MHGPPNLHLWAARLRRAAVVGLLLLAAYDVRTYFVSEILTFRVGQRLFVQVGSRTPDWLTIHLFRRDPADIEMAGTGVYERFDFPDYDDFVPERRPLGSEWYWDRSPWLLLRLSAFRAGNIVAAARPA